MVYIINHFGHSGSLNWVFEGDFLKLLLLVLENIYLILPSYDWSLANSYSLWIGGLSNTHKQTPMDYHSF